MIERPERQVAEFVKAGADSITIHVEATPHVHYALQAVREGGCTAGAAICPATPVAMLAEAAADGVLDLALCMSVNPGWGNQTLIPHSFEKLRGLRAMLADDGRRRGRRRRQRRHGQSVAEAGANLLVAGTAVFGAADPGAAFTAITAAAWPTRRAPGHASGSSGPRGSSGFRTARSRARNPRAYSFRACHVTTDSTPVTSSARSIWRRSAAAA